MILGSYIGVGILFWIFLQMHPDTIGLVPLRIILIWSIAFLIPKLYARLLDW